MKFRNRGKHGFKRLRRQVQVFDYCKTRISRGDTFKIDDICKDLKIAHSTVVEVLQELSERDDNFIYQRGCIKIKGVGNNGYGQLAENEKGLVVKKMSKTTKSRLEKKERVFNYLCYLVNNNQKIPCLSYLSKRFTDMHMTTVMDILKQLDKENKIIYKHGQVIAVNVPDVKSDKQKTLKYNSGSDEIEEKTCKVVIEEDKVEINTSSKVLSDTSKYDKAVKDLIAEYILNADITTRDEMISYIDSLMKITDKLKEKLYKE